jgi:hypothetical protein
MVTNRDDVGYFSLAPIANSLECASALGLLRVCPAEGCLVAYLGPRHQYHRQCECRISDFCTSSLLLVSVNRILRPYIIFFAPSRSRSSSSTHSLPPFPLPPRTCSMPISSPSFASCSNPSFCLLLVSAFSFLRATSPAHGLFPFTFRCPLSSSIILQLCNVMLITDTLFLISHHIHLNTPWFDVRELWPTLPRSGASDLIPWPRGRVKYCPEYWVMAILKCKS